MIECEKKLLTIAIPTFNRNDVLYRNLERLLPITEEWAQIIIIDNASDVPVINSIDSLLKRYIDANITIIRNSNNIGANSNFLRCIEISRTRYIWILGDDDFPRPDALQKIGRYLKEDNPAWINFYSDDVCQPKRLNNRVLLNLEGFLDSFDSISELVFVSTNIYDVRIMKKGLEYGYNFQAMMAPHLVAMIAGIKKTDNPGNFIITNDLLFESVSNNKDPNASWALYRAFIGIFGLYKIPFDEDREDASVSKKILKLIRGARNQWLSNKNLAIGFSDLSKKRGVLRAFIETLDFCVMLIIVDKFKSIISIPVYAISIFIGNGLRNLIAIKKYL